MLFILESKENILTWFLPPKVMSEEITEEEKIRLTPETGFNLAGIDYFESKGNRLYFVEYFDAYQDALAAKKEKKISENYLILYKGAGNEYCSR